MKNNHVPTFFAKIRLEVVSLRKGQKRRIWTSEQKSEIVHKHLDDHISVRTLEREYQADRSMICRWVKNFLAEGKSSFVYKGHPSNPFAALHSSKHLSEMEQLRLMVAKLEIENERLKKDTWWKELVQTRSSLLETQRIRGHRNSPRKISS
ncbi:hypothetical protein [Oscillibacter sp. PC13]|uniref:hypothetical protein n=1 Tax=Oscillibacter sp. PC13 TaxID=1855299 RepID=UPI000B883233|nr:hypothetical protein [Oscillibacter sp. PC13]